MNKISEQTIQGDSWIWPVNLVEYDTSTKLTNKETKTLEALCAPLDRGERSRPPNTARKLRRLLVPLNAVFDNIKMKRENGRWAVRVLLKEMHRRQTTYWAWSWDEWHETMAPASSNYRSNVTAPLRAVAYLLRGYDRFHDLGQYQQNIFARKIFGQEWIEAATQPVWEELLGWGYGSGQCNYRDVVNILCELMIVNHSPRLENLTDEVMRKVSDEYLPYYLKRPAVRVSRALVDLGYLSQPLEPLLHRADEAATRLLDNISPGWVSWCQRWRDTSILTRKTRYGHYYHLLKVGRWLAVKHPEIVSPEEWTRELAAEYVAAVDRMLIGDFNGPHTSIRPEWVGKPYSAKAKMTHVSALMTFFRDLQEWTLIPRKFTPERTFNTWRKLKGEVSPNPRVIADDWWAKLLWAGLNLTPEDLEFSSYTSGEVLSYPFEMARTVTLTWLFSGLRNDEIRRLPVGCVRWQAGELAAGSALSDAVCLLDVPVNKTSGAFTKPVARLMGTAIEAWERVRPAQPLATDRKTGERVQYLFYYRGKPIGREYINRSIIPTLCRKAGIPECDARGRITSHRARATIATQLANAREPMSLLELQQWLGHRSPNSTQHYVKITPVRLTQSYADAGYFDRNVRTIQVLLDQEVIKNGAAASGEPWKYYDLGHGYCTYDFFDQCPHRMACAKCAFYRPKDSSETQLLEAKANLQRMLQEIPLTSDEQAAVEDGVEAVTRLMEQLADIPTPAGPTPRQLEDSGFIPLEAIEVRSAK